MIDTATAEHEAAHVVVGVALGLRLKKATIKGTRDAHGYVQFAGQGRVRRTVAFGIMYAAGAAWERRPGGDLDHAITDIELACKFLGGLSNMQTGIRVADDILASRRSIHRRIASELCDRDLGPGDIERIVIGG